MNSLNDLHNPQKITGVLLWNNGNPYEVSTNDGQAFQEYPKSVELWQITNDGRLLRVQRWLKKSITHFVINNQFVPKN